MNIHEYQAKEILKNFNVKIQEGYVANSPDEAYQNAKKLSDEKNTNIFVIKAQIHAGGRGKGKVKKFLAASHKKVLPKKTILILGSPPIPL